MFINEIVQRNDRSTSSIVNAFAFEGGERERERELEERETEGELEERKTEGELEEREREIDL